VLGCYVLYVSPLYLPVVRIDRSGYVVGELVLIGFGCNTSVVRVFILCLSYDASRGVLHEEKLLYIASIRSRVNAVFLMNILGKLWQGRQGWIPFNWGWSRSAGRGKTTSKAEHCNFQTAGRV
jgi:hypothetical protein